MINYIGLLLCAGLLCVAGCRGVMQDDAPIAPPPVKQPEKEFNGKHDAKAPESAMETLFTITTGVNPNPAVTQQRININKLIMPDSTASRFLSSDCFVTRWNVLGPFIYDPEISKPEELSELIHKSFAEDEKNLTGVEKTGNPNVGWQLVRFESNKYPGEIDLSKLFNGKVRHAAAYAVTYLNCAEPTSNLTLYTGGSGFLKVWINHKLVHTYNQTPREGKWDQDTVKGIKLQQGFNQIVVKTVSTGDEWNFYFRLAAENDLPLKFQPE
ncbi:MAG: hypothetical protein ACYC4Q_02900 [Victivallaceae bacterium]